MPQYSLDVTKKYLIGDVADYNPGGYSTLAAGRVGGRKTHRVLAETMREAATLVEQGHIRVGPETVTDPAYIVTRSMEDYVTWVDTSKIKRHVQKYNDKLDDFDLL